MLRFTIASLRSVSKSFGSRASIPPRSPLPGLLFHHLGCSLRSACELTVVSAQLLSAMRLGRRSGWAGVSRRLTGSTGESFGRAELMTLIDQCTDAAGLLRLVEKHGQSFDADHVFVAWGTVREMPSAAGRGDEGLVLQRLQVLTRGKIGEWDAQLFTIGVNLMAELHLTKRMEVDDELAGELQAGAKAKLGDFKPQDVSILILGLSRMGILDAGLVAAMQGRARETAGDFEAQEIAQLMSALAIMGIRLEPDLLAAMQGRARETASDFEAQEVAQLMSTLAMMSIRLAPDLLAAMQARATVTAGAFLPRDVVLLLMSLASAGVTNPDAGLVAAMQGRATATARAFLPHQVASLMTSLATMQIRPDAGLVSAMQGRAAETAGDFEPEEVARLLVALELMGIQPDASLATAIKGRAYRSFRE